LDALAFDPAQSIETEQSMGDVTAAFEMIDAFASVGANAFVVTKTDLLQRLKWGKTYPLNALREKLPAMVRTAAIRRPVQVEAQTLMAGENLIVRPAGEDVAFIQLDDLRSGQLDRIRPAVFLLHATSPGSFQGWIAVSNLTGRKEVFKDLTRNVRRAVGANDKSASHATRLAGTENFKAKYHPDFPLVTILETHPGRIMTAKQLEAQGLLAPSATPTHRTQVTRLRPEAAAAKEQRWPSYEISLAGAPTSDDGCGPDRSRADFWWCYLALQRKWSVEDTEAKLLEVSEKARERVQIGDPGYVHQTVINALAAVERGRRNRA
jgi:hypothetical protein